MKRITAFLLCAALFLGALASCSAPREKNGEKISVVTTIFPIYDWVRQIVGDRADRFEITMLLDNGVDLHSYQPTAEDIVTISTCDMFIYVGGASDEWASDALAQAVNRDMTVIDLMEVLGEAVKEEEVKEGMEAEEAEEEGEEETEYDEHVWLSLRNAAVCCRRIGEKIGEKASDPDGFYQNATNAYVEKLEALDAEYEKAVGEAAGPKTLVFADRFPFRYMFDDYGLDYYAAFSGCSAETEASFETIAFLAGKVDELGLKSIMQIESADGKIAATVRDTTKSKDQEILTMNSLQSTTARDVADGASYLAAMEQNLAVLRDALK